MTVTEYGRKYRELTVEEVEALPFDMRLCFYVQPWNVSAEFKSVDDWLSSFECMWREGSLATIADLISKAKRLHEGGAI